MQETNQKTETEAEVHISNALHTSTFQPYDVVTVDRFSSAMDDQRQQMEIAWKAIENSYYTKSVLNGTVLATEEHSIGNDTKITVTVVDYEGLRVIIPVEQMNIYFEAADEKEAFVIRNKICANMIGAQVSFIVIAIDRKEHSVMASRELAMKKLARSSYIEKRVNGHALVEEGSIVEARVLTVATTILRLEVMGVECLTSIYELQDEWITDARDAYYIGQVIPVKVHKIIMNDEADEVIRIACEGKSVRKVQKHPCIPGSKYIGTVTRIRNGMYYIRLHVGTNAIAYTSVGIRKPPKKGDTVSFVCRRMEDDSNIAVGLVTDIIRSNGL